MIQIVFLRHGQSVWNLDNRFTGWTDVDLSARGMDEAREAGHLLQRHGFDFDVAITSVLKRAIRTLWVTLDEMDRMWLPVEKDWRLNERHYGGLQGLHKRETQEQYGVDQVRQWRRGFSVRPPALDADDPRHARFDPRYRDIDPGVLPSTESLEDTMARVMPWWERYAVPHLAKGQRLLICAHGNSLRALVKHLDHISDDAIMDVNIPTGIPLVYELDDTLAVTNQYYLADSSRLQAAMKEIADQPLS